VREKVEPDLKTSKTNQRTACGNSLALFFVNIVYVNLSIIMTTAKISGPMTKAVAINR